MMVLLLCLFLGWIGGHKFYEGKSLMGIIKVMRYYCSHHFLNLS
ncbi:NINE protein [Clostridium lacusfryxellense]|nr:TM2 domain-containing protein [Clostridium lacusfryxellense]